MDGWRAGGRGGRWGGGIREFLLAAWIGLGWVGLLGAMEKKKRWESYLSLWLFVDTSIIYTRSRSHRCVHSAWMKVPIQDIFFSFSSLPFPLAISVATSPQSPKTSLLE